MYYNLIYKHSMLKLFIVVSFRKCLNVFYLLINLSTV